MLHCLVFTVSITLQYIYSIQQQQQQQQQQQGSNTDITKLKRSVFVPYIVKKALH